MSEQDEQHNSKVLQRIERLERRMEQSSYSANGILGDLDDTSTTTVSDHPAWPLVSGSVAMACGYLGVGLPHHHYQFMFAALILLLGYHRQVFLRYSSYWQWPLVLVNYLLLCLLLKLLIGGGTSRPLEWIKLPTLGTAQSETEPSWYRRVVPQLELRWEGVDSISDWSFDMTRIQALLLIITVLSAMLRFQPFASFIALLLLATSIPTFFAYQWDWIILFLVFGSAALYMQTQRPQTR